MGKRQNRARLEARKRRDSWDQAPSRQNELPKAEEIIDFIQSLPDNPTSWPGSLDSSLSRPDLIKWKISQILETSPGREKFNEFIKAVSKGVLEKIPGIASWAMEEFLWHGTPGDSWNPIDAYLAQCELPGIAKEQIRLWKEASLGIWEIQRIQNDMLTIREWDCVTKSYCSPPIQAISLSMGGVNAYRNSVGDLAVCYVAPWRPEKNLVCMMGYGLTDNKDECLIFNNLLALRDPARIMEPLPWKKSRNAEAQCWSEWKKREWQSWLEDRLQFPFHAIVQNGPQSFTLAQMNGMLPGSAEQARQMGIYIHGNSLDDKTQAIMAGASSIVSLDFLHPNWFHLLEYQEYRNRSGPPPGVKNAPTWNTFPR